ncbi:MAG: carboxymuconolactone decarboxylase family protein [Phycisphaeraceae bacterium]
MPVVPPLSPEAAPDSTRAIYDRIKETIGGGQVSLGFQMMGRVESFLQDSYMNYRKYIHDGAGKLDAKQRAAIALATSSAMNCHSCVKAHARDAMDAGWSDGQVAEILAVTATCTMYNVFYKFKDLAENADLAGRSVGLRAHTWQKVSLDQTLVELINIVVSNINTCKSCTSGHVEKALQLGLTGDQIDEALKVSAVMAAFNTFHRTQ